MKRFLILMTGLLFLTLNVRGQVADDGDIYIDEDFAATYYGGYQALFAYVAENLQYPKKAAENNVEGIVVVRFKVGKDGSVSDVSIHKSLTPECDKEAVRVVKGMPKWIPGYRHGNPIECTFLLPLKFVAKEIVEDDNEE